MTEDRNDDGTGGGPESDGSLPPLPTESTADSSEPNEPNESDELVPEMPDGPVEAGKPDTSSGLDGTEPILVPEPSEPTTPDAHPNSQPVQASPTEETDGLRKQVEAKDAQLAQVMTAYRALKKETERLRKRIETHQKRRFEQSKNDFIGNFVEVLDNLDRAIDSIENNFDSDAVLEGIILVRSRMVQLLREEGLEKIFVGGQSFDPTHSEAAGIEPVEDPSQDNIVLKELQRGYMLKGALLRPARVIVGRYSHAAGEPTTEQDLDTSSSSTLTLDEDDEVSS